MKMECGCYLNGFGFRVGRKYVTFYNVASGKIRGKLELDEYTLGRLQEIKEMYRCEDARRTRAVRDLVLGREEEEEEE